MASRPVSFTRVAQPVRSLWHRFAYVALVFAAFGLMLLGKADMVIVERTRVAVTDAMVPILEVLSEPAGSMTRALDRVAELRDLQGEVERLKLENARLRQWQHVATGLQAENQALKRLTHFVAPPTPRVISGRAISNAGGPFVRSILVNVGARQGARRGLAAVSGSGFVGVVVEVGEHHSRVLLMTDLNSQIPVTVQTTRDPGVLSGDNSNRPRLLFLPQNAHVSTGDPVVTSGEGGVLPAGLPVGVIAAISETGVQVKPIVDWDRLEYIQFLDYRIEGSNSQPFSEAQPGTPLKALTAPESTSSGGVSVIGDAPSVTTPLVGAEGSGRP
jgi:rod shape-determining protein MreC